MSAGYKLLTVHHLTRVVWQLAGRWHLFPSHLHIQYISSSKLHFVLHFKCMSTILLPFLASAPLPLICILRHVVLVLPLLHCLSVYLLLLATKMQDDIHAAFHENRAKFF